MTYRLKSGDLRILSWVVDRILHVVKCDAAIRSTELIITELRNTFVGAVLCMKVENRGPVLLQL